MTWFLGMDGGGTKTEFVLPTARATSSPAAPSRPATTSAHREGSRASSGSSPTACGRHGGGRPRTVEFAFFAFPGYGEVSGDVAALDDLPRGSSATSLRLRQRHGQRVGRGAGARDGVNVVAGTGSIAYGERAGGPGARAGGANCSGTRVRRTGWPSRGCARSPGWPTVAARGLPCSTRCCPPSGCGTRTTSWGRPRRLGRAAAPRSPGWPRRHRRRRAGRRDGRGGRRAAAAELADLVESTALALGHARGTGSGSPGPAGCSGGRRPRVVREALSRSRSPSTSSNPATTRGTAAPCTHGRWPPGGSPVTGRRS